MYATLVNDSHLGEQRKVGFSWLYFFFSFPICFIEKQWKTLIVKILLPILVGLIVGIILGVLGSIIGFFVSLTDDYLMIATYSAIQLAISWLVGSMVSFAIHLFLCSKYNKWYIRGLLEKGFHPLSEQDEAVLAGKGLWNRRADANQSSVGKFSDSFDDLVFGKKTINETFQSLKSPEPVAVNSTQNFATAPQEEDSLQQLMFYKDLLEQGLITEDEFSEKKKELL